MGRRGQGNIGSAGRRLTIRFTFFSIGGTYARISSTRRVHRRDRARSAPDRGGQHQHRRLPRRDRARSDEAAAGHQLRPISPLFRRSGARRSQLPGARDRRLLRQWRPARLCLPDCRERRGDGRDQHRDRHQFARSAGVRPGRLGRPDLRQDHRQHHQDRRRAGRLPTPGRLLEHRARRRLRSLRRTAHRNEAERHRDLRRPRLGQSQIGRLLRQPARTGLGPDPPQVRQSPGAEGEAGQGDQPAGLPQRQSPRRHAGRTGRLCGDRYAAQRAHRAVGARARRLSRRRLGGGAGDLRRSDPQGGYRPLREQPLPLRGGRLQEGAGRSDRARPANDSAGYAICRFLLSLDRDPPTC